MMMIDRLIAGLLAVEARYREAVEQQKRAYDLADSCLKDRLAAYDGLKEALPDGRCYVAHGHAALKDGDGNLLIVPLAD